MQIKMTPHTILVLIGPSNCGKTTFCKDLVKRCPDAQIVSSDDERRFLLNENLDKMDRRMMPVSRQAFDLLSTKVDLLSQFPVNCPYIVVDSTGLDDRFQEEMVKIAKKNNYKIECVIFDYKNSGDYTRHIPKDSRQALVTIKNVKKLRRKTMPNINSGFISKYRVRDWGEYSFEIDPLFDLWYGCHFDLDKKYLAIGDVHGCFKDMLNMIHKFDGQVILLGDYIDKGPNVAETIHFLHGRPNIITLTGNHEHYVYLRVTGKLAKQDADKHFDSIDMLEKDRELRDKFIALYEASLPFINIDNKYVLTHAPCYTNQLCKVDRQSQRCQRNFRYTQLSEDETLMEIQKMGADRTGCYPTQIFGHITFNRTYNNNHMVGIDLGVVDGGELCGVILE